MLKYGKDIRFDLKKLDPLNIDRQSISLIPKRSKILEIGCATGFMGEYLIKKKECEVIGVELGKEEARQAKKKLTKVILGDIEEQRVIDQIKKEGKFDVVFASAVLEHLKDPRKALFAWRRFLKRGGKLIITTSNIAHWSARLRLFFGKFDYEDYGIFDNTHLHFFTIKTFKQIVNHSGYDVDCFFIDSVGGGFPRISKFLSRFFPNLFAYQMLIVAVPV